MNGAFWDMLANQAKPRELETLSPLLQQKLRSLSDDLVLLLSISDPDATSQILTKLCAEVLSHLAELDVASRPGSRTPANPQSDIKNGKQYSSEPIPPEILEWARKNLNEEETAAGLREIRETGGLELADFIQELEQSVTPLE